MLSCVCMHRLQGLFCLDVHFVPGRVLYIFSSSISNFVEIITKWTVIESESWPTFFSLVHLKHLRLEKDTTAPPDLAVPQTCANNRMEQK